MHPGLMLQPRLLAVCFMHRMVLVCVSSDIRRYLGTPVQLERTHAIIFRNSDGASQTLAAPRGQVFVFFFGRPGGPCWSGFPLGLHSFFKQKHLRVAPSGSAAVPTARWAARLGRSGSVEPRPDGSARPLHPQLSHKQNRFG